MANMPGDSPGARSLGGRVTGHDHEPGSDARALLAETGSLSPQAQENLIQDFLRRAAVAQDAQQHAEEDGRKAVIELAQRAGVAFSNAGQQVFGSRNFLHESGSEI